jgi:hypothetical protein
VHSATSYAIGHAEGDGGYDAFLDSVHDWADNLRSQGYSRIVSVLLAFQWSDSAFGPPWIRSEESQPPRSDASTEVEAMFVAERMARDPNLYRILERSRIRRTGPVGLMEARVLDSEICTRTEAKLLGKALPILQWLDPVERDVLVLMKEPLGLPELHARARKLNLEKGDVSAAVCSLIRRGLVLPVNDRDPD